MEYKSIYELGMDAFEDGQSQTDNPYECPAENYYEWLSGFVEARGNDIPDKD